VNAVVDYASEQIGKPYMWGQAGPDAFDCSGLTMMAWRAGGVPLSHYTVTQYAQTTHRPISQAQPGDLIFWSLGGAPAPYHVAIYAGGGDVIEAPATGIPVRRRALGTHESDVMSVVGALPAAAGGLDYSAGLTAEQLGNARTIVSVVKDAGLPERAAEDALMAADTESGLRNLAYGDRDSLGLFQQRPSAGWGTPEQVQDPIYATRAFLARLVNVPNWSKLAPWAAVQDVQVSAFPDGSNYQQNWGTMAPLADQLYGAAGGATSIVPASSTSGGGTVSDASLVSAVTGSGWLGVLVPGAGLVSALGGQAASSVGGEVAAFAANVGLKLLLAAGGVALVVAGIVHTTAPARQQAAQAAPLLAA